MIGGDNAGYPNGRRPTDDVVDIDLQVVAGILVDNPVPLGDGVDTATSAFLAHVPVPGTDPDSGFDSNPGQYVEPAHPPVPPEAAEPTRSAGERRDGRSPRRPARPSTEETTR